MGSSRHARSSSPCPASPPDLRALVTEEDDFAILSIPLPSDSEVALSPAESEVAFLIACGRTNAEIAVLRRSAVRTVANQVASLFRKLGVRSRLELVTQAALLRPRGTGHGSAM